MVLAWAIRHFKVVLALISLCITAVITPAIIFLFDFFVASKATQANVLVHDTKIHNLEQAVYRSEERYLFIKESLVRLEESKYNELRKARQERLLNK